ncbi:MAG: hypothetical protein M1830_003942 [Pleopsidium flavum]|nr:MAG: hypothetical protein M1830_003942 [Pleopsidium flavum]
MTEKCVHKGCGKAFSDPTEDCLYHPGPPIFHEGQKGWKCCKPRVLTFDEFLSIPPCTTGKHSTIDDTPAPEPSPSQNEATEEDIPAPKPIATTNGSNQASQAPTARPPQPSQPPAPSPAPPESESDDPSLEIPAGTTCRRRGCNETYTANTPRTDEQCVYHPGQALFHEGTKGWTCCKRRVLEFDEFMKIEGCKRKGRHLFVGKGEKNKGGGEEVVESVRHDFYQTSSSVIASLYLKKIEKEKARVEFLGQSVEVDLPTADRKRYKTSVPLYAPIDSEKSSYKIMGTKVELTLAKADGSSWPVLRSDERATGEIIQVGKPGRA